MRTKTDPWTLTGNLRKRSACRVQMAAVVSDSRGVFAWGWNHAGADGRGMCAERHALTRANPKRLGGAQIHVRGSHGRNESTSMPCPACQAALRRAGVSVVHYRDQDKERKTASVRALSAHA